MTRIIPGEIYKRQGRQGIVGIKKMMIISGTPSYRKAFAYCRDPGIAILVRRFSFEEVTRSVKLIINILISFLVLGTHYEVFDTKAVSGIYGTRFLLQGQTYESSGIFASEIHGCVLVHTTECSFCQYNLSFRTKHGKGTGSSSKLKSVTRSKARIDNGIVKGEMGFRDVFFPLPYAARASFIAGHFIYCSTSVTWCSCGWGLPRKEYSHLINPVIIRTIIRWRILVDGTALSTMNPQAHLRSVGIVSQEPKLLVDTIRENLLFGLTGESVSDTAIILLTVSWPCILW